MFALVKKKAPHKGGAQTDQETLLAKYCSPENCQNAVILLVATLQAAELHSSPTFGDSEPLCTPL